MASTKKPKLKIKLTKFDWSIEAIIIAMLLFHLYFVIFNYFKLPDIVPTHYSGISGGADAFGSKEAIFLMPGIAILFFVGLSFINKYPHIFNYPIDITEENAFKEYRLITRFIRFIKLEIILMFGLFSFLIDIPSSYENNFSLNLVDILSFALLYFLMLISSIVYLILTDSIRKKQKVKQNNATELYPDIEKNNKIF